MMPRRAMALSLAVLLAAPMVGSIAYAADDAGVAGAFLRFGSSARTLGMGNAVTAMPDDTAGAYWNPAGLALLRTMELTGMGATLFDDTQFTFFSLGLPTENAGTFALTGSFFTSGSFERATLFEDLDESFSESSGLFALSYARGTGRFAWGVSLKSVSQTVAGASGGGIGADLGLYFRPHRSISFGMAYQNAIAPTITLDQQPEEFARSLRGGTALHFFQNRLLVSSDLIKTDTMDLDFRSGIEVWANRSFALRSGYDTVAEQSTFGAAFRWENWQIDYSFLNHALGGTNVLSATLRFGVPYGVKVHRDRTLFSPSGEDKAVEFAIDTAVRGTVENWQLVIQDDTGKQVRVLEGHGTPPEGVTWSGEDDNGRLVEDGNYHVKVVILDELGEQWDYDTSVRILGFQSRTRSPIRVEISGSESEPQEGKDR